jgi:hypothetical protein
MNFLIEAGMLDFYCSDINLVKAATRNSWRLHSPATAEAKAI